jgi:RimJ/RimL family protein N-acetyltransferase
VCIIDPPNVASRRVAAKLGYHELGLVDYRSSQVVVFERCAAA